MRRACASAVSFGVSASGSRDIGGLFEMVAGAVGELAVIDEHGRPAVLRHQRIGQRQRRMRDVGAADVEGPGHRMANPTAPAHRRRAWRSRAGCASSFSASASPANCGRGWRPGRAAARGVRSRPNRPGCCRPRPVPRRPWRRPRPAVRLPPKCAATDQIRGGRRLSDAATASFPAADRPAARRSRPWRRPVGRPAACSGRRRTPRPRCVSTIASPADPVKPVSQASRSSEGATYSFCC